MLKKPLDGSLQLSPPGFFSIFYLFEQKAFLPWVVIVAIGDFLVGRQLFLHRLAVDCKTPKHITSKKIEYVTEKT